VSSSEDVSAGVEKGAGPHSVGREDLDDAAERPGGVSERRLGECPDDGGEAVYQGF
jgi:hypothetical protein